MDDDNSELELEDPWTLETETVLFECFHRFLPVGLNENFFILTIQTVILRSTGVFIRVDDIRSRLNKFVEFKLLSSAMKDSALFKLPPKVAQKEFSLPTAWLSQKQRQYQLK